MVHRSRRWMNVVVVVPMIVVREVDDWEFAGKGEVGMRVDRRSYVPRGMNS